MIIFFFFFFKQKTAYEMVMSDWSSDVCSSDLGRIDHLQVERGAQPPRQRGVVVQLDRILVIEAEVEPLAQELQEVGAEVGVRPADAEGIARPPRNHAVA